MREGSGHPELLYVAFTMKIQEVKPEGRRLIGFFM